MVGIEAAGINADALPRSAAEKVVDRLPGDLAHEIPEGNIHCTDRLDGDAFAAEIDGTAEHFLPQHFHFERICPDDDRSQAVFQDIQCAAVARAHAAIAFVTRVGTQPDNHRPYGPASQPDESFAEQAAVIVKDVQGR